MSLTSKQMKQIKKAATSKRQSSSKIPIDIADKNATANHGEKTNIHA